MARELNSCAPKKSNVRGKRSKKHSVNKASKYYVKPKVGQG